MSHGQGDQESQGGARAEQQREEYQDCEYFGRKAHLMILF